MKRIHVRFENSTQEAISKIADKSNYTVSAIAREAMDIGVSIIEIKLNEDKNLTLKQISQEQYFINKKK